MNAPVITLDRTGLVPPSTDGSPWPLPPAGERVRLGSDAHRVLFSRTMLDLFDPYRPAVLDWPKLDAHAQERITSLPIWDIAVQTEGKAGTRMQNYADTVEDDLVRRALDLNAFEERRHKVVLSCLVAAYDIPLEPEPEYKIPKDREWAYMVTGFSECVDSFFAFGLFETARRSGFFPAELVETFEPVVREEGRHIMFFVNWVAWRRRQLSILQRVAFEMKVWAVWVFLGYERMGIASGMDEKGDAQKAKVRGAAPKPQDNNFTVTGASQVGNDIDVWELMALCLSENDRRLGVYDRRLVQPMFMPTLVKIALKVMRRDREGKRIARGRTAPAAAAA